MKFCILNKKDKKIYYPYGTSGVTNARFIYKIDFVKREIWINREGYAHPDCEPIENFDFILNDRKRSN